MYHWQTGQVNRLDVRGLLATTPSSVVYNYVTQKQASLSNFLVKI